MTIFAPLSRLAPAAIAALFSLALVTPIPAAAQDENSARLRKIEAEIRALQRQVFPGGDGRFFEPEIRPDAASSPATAAGGAPDVSTSALTGVLARLDALESQLQRLTALGEENANAISRLGERVDAVEARPRSQMRGEGSGDDLSEAPDSMDADNEGDPVSASEANLSAMGANSGDQNGSEASTAPAQQTAPAAPSPERIAAVQAITKPQSGDAGDDEYTYGFRLWDAGFFPEARQQLGDFVESYPDHWRATYGRNLLGRAYLDDEEPENAARWFLRNYQTDRTGVRAPDSLLYLARSMIALDDTDRACIALAQLSESYPAIAAGRLSDEYQQTLSRVSCEG